MDWKETNLEEEDDEEEDNDDETGIDHLTHVCHYFAAGAIASCRLLFFLPISSLLITKMIHL